jgi:hypothetical protein
MLCRVDGFRVWVDALPPGVSSRCFAAIISYDSTSLLATIGLSSYVLGSVSWGCQWRVPPYVSCFSFLLWTSLVIHGLLANPCIGYFDVLSALLLNEKRVKSRSRKKGNNDMEEQIDNKQSVLICYPEFSTCS